jgi:hypothetical protein
MLTWTRETIAAAARLRLAIDNPSLLGDPDVLAKPTRRLKDISPNGFRVLYRIQKIERIHSTQTTTTDLRRVAKMAVGQREQKARRRPLCTYLDLVAELRYVSDNV